MLEVMIAVGITALIGIGVWQMINGVIRARDRVDDVADDFETLQRAMLVIERDITQVVNRPVRDIYGDARYAMTSREEGVAVALTRQGWRNPIGSRRSDLQRVNYEFTGDELHRRYWGMLDVAQDAEGRDQLLVSDVVDFQVRFMDENGNWEEDWPPADAAQEASGSPASLTAIAFPRGIEITLDHERFGEITRLFALPDFDPESAQGLVTDATESDDEADDEDTDEGAAEDDSAADQSDGEATQ